MKRFSLSVLALLALSTGALANIPGGRVKHSLHCEPVGTMVVGVSYGVNIETAALPPQYNVVGATLVTRAVAPRAKPKYERLVPQSQDLRSAVFSSTSGLTVTFDKSTFSASIYYGRNLAFYCKN